MKWVSIHTTNVVAEAEVLQKMLESYGIPVRLRYEAYGRVMAMRDGIGSADILVPENRAEEARELLEPTNPEPADS